MKVFIVKELNMQNKLFFFLWPIVNIYSKAVFFVTWGKYVTAVFVNELAAAYSNLDMQLR